jgi:cysteine desulfurase
LPHILNVSYLPLPSFKTMARLAEKDIFVSNFTACTSNNDKSFSVFALANDELFAHTSIRISLSWQTTEAEIDQLVFALIQIGKSL